MQVSALGTTHRVRLCCPGDHHSLHQISFLPRDPIAPEEKHVGFQTFMFCHGRMKIFILLHRNVRISIQQVHQLDLIASAPAIRLAVWSWGLRDRLVI